MTCSRHEMTDKYAHLALNNNHTFYILHHVVYYIFKNASRRVFIYAGFIFIICGLFGKVGAIFTMLPDPVLGGTVVLSFGMVTAVGLSTLQFVDLSSGRNLCIIGSSLLIGLMVPRYLAENKDAIKTGMPTEESKFIFGV
jgi:nucleobase transporter 1/2